MPAPADEGAAAPAAAASGPTTLARPLATDAAGHSLSEHDPVRRPCDNALVRAFGFLGKRWNGVILANLLEGTAGFSELRRAVGAISDSVLSERLSELTEAGLIERAVNPGPPVAVTYTLTAAGTALLPAMHALADWAEDHLPDSGGHPGA
jgi:DNA-binding HxlR family transcriptional regulator